MKLNVKNNAKKNMVFGILNKIIAMACPFIVRTVTNYYLGKEYLGLGSLFSSILTILSLSELGLSDAIVYSMYKPVANDDIETVNSLLNFYKRVYRYIGICILVVGVCLIPFLPKLISGGYPNNINLVWLYTIYLLNTCLSYFLYAYATSLIVVYQRSDVMSNINSTITLGLTIAQIISIIITRNYMIFAFMMPIFTVLNNFRVYYAVKKMFPQYKCEGRISKELLCVLKEKISGTLIAKLCGVSRNSFDNITISAFLGLTVTGMYGNYYYIIAAVYSFMSIISTSLIGGIGNHIVTRSANKNYNEMKKIDFLYMWIAGWCSICILCLMQPFMEVWMGKGMILSFKIVVLLTFYFYLERTIDIRGIYVSVSGLWDKLKIQSLVEAIVNIVLNIVLGKIWGLYGVIIATIISILFINIIWKNKITFMYIFGEKMRSDYHRYHIAYFINTIVAALLTLGACTLYKGTNIYLCIIYRGGCCSIIPNIWYLIRYKKLSYFNEAISLVGKVHTPFRKDGERK